MSRKQKSQKSINQPIDPIAKEIRALERKLEVAKRERAAKSKEQQEAREGFYADLQKEVAPLNTEINRIESALFETRARYRSISGGGEGVTGRDLHRRGSTCQRRCGYGSRGRRRRRLWSRGEGADGRPDTGHSVPVASHYRTRTGDGA